MTYIVHDDGEEEINVLTYLLTYLLTYFRQLFVTCYVHTINRPTCFMQWMFLPCNEMPASGPRPLHSSELAYRWLIAGLSLAYRWLIAGLSLAYRWLIAGLSLAYRWLIAGLSLITDVTGMGVRHCPAVERVGGFDKLTNGKAR